MLVGIMLVGRLGVETPPSQGPIKGLLEVSDAQRGNGIGKGVLEPNQGS